MAAADENNITLRLLANGGVDRPVTLEEADQNFIELVNIITDHKAHVEQYKDYVKKIFTTISLSELSRQTYFADGVEDVFSTNGNQLEVSASTKFYHSPLMRPLPFGYVVDVNNIVGGEIEVVVKGFDNSADQVTTSSDVDFTVNSNNGSFDGVNTPINVGQNTEIVIEFTDAGILKSEFISVELSSSSVGVLSFAVITLRG